MVAAVIPILSFIAFLPAFGAAVLGIMALVRHSPRRGRAIAGVILGVVALVVAIAVSVAAIGVAAGSLAGSRDEVPTAEEASPSATPEPTVEEEVEATDAPASAAHAVPAVPAVPAENVYTGTGDSILAITLPDGGDVSSVATITHGGSSNFAVWSLDGSMTQQDLLVNTIGAYQGTVLFNEQSTAVTAFEITADGAWTVTVRSILSLREFTGPSVTGAGDDVVIYRGDAGAAALTHDGQSNFSMWFYGDSTDLVVNEIGPYTGTVRWGAGPAVIAVNADGNWSVTVD
jgi:hypothetical protein